MSAPHSPPSEPFSVGDRVQIHIPDTDDFDHEKHGMTGRIENFHVDDASQLPGARHELDDYTYKVRLDNGGLFPARHSDLRAE